VMWVGIETFGKAAHAGAPETGDNAIARMLRLLSHLQTSVFPAIESREKDGAVSTYNIGKINGGSNTNVVPSRCWVEIDRRLLPGETVAGAHEEIIASLEQAGEPRDSWRTELLCGTNGFASPSGGKMVSALME